MGTALADNLACQSVASKSSTDKSLPAKSASGCVVQYWHKPLYAASHQRWHCGYWLPPRPQLVQPLALTAGWAYLANGALTALSTRSGVAPLAILPQKLALLLWPAQYGYRWSRSRQSIGVK